ncbi:hypothetical protein Pcinc_020698 [Petrolisthes cinctipes]|uniref:Uncharacterized protein n=1 Tax=Petrolisthes cinctipes TaxID=88211 RepID=A0AAE1KJH6_PETCI|nr:hypothetical protein Pcinc_020698 [Petrolisthes cinctipes]
MPVDSASFEGERSSSTPKKTVLLKTVKEMDTIVSSSIRELRKATPEYELMIEEKERETDAKKQKLLDFIRDELEGDIKGAIRALDIIKEEYDEQRKRHKKGQLYNSKAVNKYVFDVTVPEIYMLLDETVRSLWHAGEHKFGEDRRSWLEDLQEDERCFLKYTLAFFAAADALVNENIMKNFVGETKLIEVKAMYTAQMFVENVHNEVYGKLLKAYITDPDELNCLFDAVNNTDVVKDKKTWAQMWIDDTYATYGERLIAFACVEGIFFSGSFASIFWFKDRKSAKGNPVLPQLVLSNEWISRDEAMHNRLAVTLHKHLHKEDRVPEARIHKIIKEATALEVMFVEEALRVDLMNSMTVKRMKQYISYTADVLLTQLGVAKVYNVENPFDFMSNIGMPMKSNFFEVKVTNYKKVGGVNDGVEASDANFEEMDCDDEDF